MKRNRIFVTGTDTGVGKTYCTSGILKAFAKQGYSTLGLKPIASGCVQNQNQQWISEDAVQLIEAASEQLAYNIINPYALVEPIAPHLAAEKMGIKLIAKDIAAHTLSVFENKIDLILVEGAGGLSVPLNQQETFVEYLQLLAIPVILIVGMRLGCINHTLLTAAVLAQQKIPLVGWYANQLDISMPMFNENVETISHFLSAPCLGVVRQNGMIPLDRLKEEILN